MDRFLRIVSFDGIFLTAFGFISVIAGIIDKGGLFWWSIRESNPTGRSGIRVVNFFFGLIGLLVGLSLLRRK